MAAKKKAVADKNPLTAANLKQATKELKEVFASKSGVVFIMRVKKDGTPVTQCTNIVGGGKMSHVITAADQMLHHLPEHMRFIAIMKLATHQHGN